MKYGIVKPKEMLFHIVDTGTIEEAQIIAGLDPKRTDMGTIERFFGIIVYEFGLYDPPETQSYFALGKLLYAGSAVIYKYDKDGETVDFEPGLMLVTPTWFASAQDVEKAITDGRIIRPIMAVGDEVIWTWPNPAPTGYL